MTNNSKLRQHIDKTIKNTGFDLFNMEVEITEKTPILRLFISHKDRPISINDCALVSHTFDDDQILDSFFKNSYTLEVSSSGITNIKSQNINTN